MQLRAGVRLRVDDCCGICRLAAGRPRITRVNASDWVPPDLNKLRGERHRPAREAEDGELMLWYWQAEGERWDLVSSSFDVAKKRYDRLAASKEERIAQNNARYERAYEAMARQKMEQMREEEERVAMSQRSSG